MSLTHPSVGPYLGVGLFRTQTMGLNQRTKWGNTITTSHSGTRIRKLRTRLELSQAQLGRSLGTSTMAISRWERGTPVPPAALIQLGILGKDADCWYFWGLAGLTADDIMQALPQGSTAKPQPGTVAVKHVAAGANHKSSQLKTSLVAIPVLPLQAAASREKGSTHHELDWAVPENLIAAPSDWCPNPAQTICLRVKGDSMEPLLHHGYILVVDRKQNNPSKLEGEMVVAHHSHYGLVVSRFLKLDGHGMLAPDNRVHRPVAFNAGWRMVGKVLWWMGVPDSTDGVASPTLPL
jgi:DNA-binding transcriptional regulator YiaG/phage repressor protein C with HTH and peptisase S24 domain